MTTGLNFGFPDDRLAVFAHGGPIDWDPVACDVCGWEPATETLRTVVSRGMFRRQRLVRICGCCSAYLHLTQIDGDRIMLQLDREMQQFRWGHPL